MEDEPLPTITPILDEYPLLTIHDGEKSRTVLILQTQNLNTTQD